MRFAFALEKILQQNRALVCLQARLNQRVVIELAVGKQVKHGAGRTCFGIGCAEHDAFQSRMQHGARTHGARFKRHKQLAIVQAVVAQDLRCSAQSHHFSVRRWVMLTDGGIAPYRNHLTLAYHHSAHGNLARKSGQTRLGQGELHGFCIGQSLTLARRSH